MRTEEAGGKWQRRAAGTIKYTKLFSYKLDYIRFKVNGGNMNVVRKSEKRGDGKEQRTYRDRKVRSNEARADSARCKERQVDQHRCTESERRAEETRANSSRSQIADAKQQGANSL